MSASTARRPPVDGARTVGLAGHPVGETCVKHGVEPQEFTLHSDRGSPMTARWTAQLLADLGVTHSLGRPRVSD